MNSDGTRNASLPRECQGSPGFAERLRERRATESPEHREARLRPSFLTTITSSSEGNRGRLLAKEATSCGMRVNQQRRLATETPEETEARLHQARAGQLSTS